MADDPVPMRVDLIGRDWLRVDDAGRICGVDTDAPVVWVGDKNWVGDMNLTLSEAHELRAALGEVLDAVTASIGQQVR